MGYLRRQKLKITFILSQLRDFLSLIEFLVPLVARQNEHIRLSDRNSPAYPQKGPKRQWSRHPNNSLCSQLQAHPCSHKHRVAQKDIRQGGNPSSRLRGKGILSGPCPGLPQQNLSPRCENCHCEPLGATPWVIFWTMDGSYLGTHHGMQGKSLIGLHRISMGFLREDSKTRKGEGFGEFERVEGSKRVH